MSRKIPPDAFTHYFSLGPGRSYEALAQKYSCSKRAVAKLAAKENWQRRLEDLEVKARAKSDQQILESLEQMNDRHLRMARMMQAKGITALQALEITAVPDALKAVQVGLEKERLIRGEPSDRTTLSVEEIVKREYAQWMVPEEESDEKPVEARAVS